MALSTFMTHRISKLAAERETANGYKAASDKWKMGMTKNPVLVGTSGECAVFQYLTQHGIDCTWNPNRIDGGDGGKDIQAGGHTLQVKTGVMWIRRMDSANRLIPLDCDIYVFVSPRPRGEFDIAGWLFREKLYRLGDKRPQGHRNIEVAPCDLEPMSRLIKLLRHL